MNMYVSKIFKKIEDYEKRHLKQIKLYVFEFVLTFTDFASTSYLTRVCLSREGIVLCSKPVKKIITPLLY